MKNSKRIISVIILTCLFLSSALFTKAANNTEVKATESYYLTEEEAKCFIGFLFNTNDLTDEQLNENDMFKLMTGQLSGLEEEHAGVQFVEFMNTRLFSTVGELESIVDDSSEFMIEYLTAKVNESPGLADEIINSTINEIGNQFLDYVLEEALIHGQGLEDMEYEFFQNGMLDAKRIEQLAGISAKVEEYKKQIQALSSAVFLAAGTNRVEMYKYFLVYKENLGIKYTIGEEAFQLIMDVNKLYNEKLTVLMSIQPTLANWPFLDEKMLLWATEDRINLIEKWAEYAYQLEKRIEDTAVSHENQENTDTDAIHYDLIDESYFEYTLTGEGAIITKYKGNHSYAKIPNTIAGYKVIAIEDNAFEDRGWLRYVYIPASVKTIGEKAFLNCTGLKKVIIPNGNVDIGDRAFGFYYKQTINGKEYVIDKALGTTLCSASNTNVQSYAESSGNFFESTDWDGKSQTEVLPVGDIYYINTPAELAWIASETNSGNTFAGKSIVISGTFNFNSKQWTPIGQDQYEGDRPFEGKIKIEDCIMENLYSHIGAGWSGNYLEAGLFGIVNTDEVYISGLKMNNADVSCDGYHSVKSGMLFADIDIKSNGIMTIEDSSFRGKSYANQQLSGGVIAELTVGNQAKVDIRQIDCNLDVGGEADYLKSMDAGGIVCVLVNSGEVHISQCNLEGKIYGLAGYNTVNQTHPGTVGGILGQVTNNSGATVFIDQIATDFEAKAACGTGYYDIIGTIISEINKNKGDIYISNTSNMIRYKGGTFNGIIGAGGSGTNVHISDSYMVNIDQEATFFKDRYKSPAYFGMDLKSIYFLNDKIKIYTGHKSAEWEEFAKQFEKNGRTDEELKNRETFIDWDFDTIWCMENDKYPQLLNLMRDKTFYKVHAQALEGGLIEESGTTNIVEGGTITYHIRPDENHEIDRVVVDGVDVGRGDSYTFTDVRAEHTIVAVFREKPVHTITYEVNGGNLPDNTPFEYREGTEITLKNPSREGYIFEGWYKEDDFSGERITHIRADMKEDIMLYAKWIQKVETPVADIESGSYEENLLITLTSKTEGADIYYTTDGSDPKSSPTVRKYTEPIELKGTYQEQKTYTLFAYAAFDGMVESEIISYRYQIQLPLQRVDKIDVLGIQEPKALEVPDLSGESPTEGVSQISSVVWNPADATFQYHMTYTVSFVVQLQEGYIFSDVPTVTLNGNIVEDVLLNDDGTMTVSYEFDSTEKKPLEIPQNITYTPVSIEGMSDGEISGVTSEMEYKKGIDGIYQDCPDGKISGLDMGEYYIRYKETDEYASSTELRIQIGYKEERTYTLSVDNIVFDSQIYGYENVPVQSIVIISSGNTNATIKRIWVENDMFMIDESNALPEVEAGKSNLTYKIRPKIGIAAGEYETTLWIEYDDNATASSNIRFSVKKSIYPCPDVNQISTVSTSYEGCNDGQIIGVSEQMEYKRAGSEEYIPCSGNTISGLYAGKYFIRYRETENFEPGQPLEVIVEEGEKRQPGKAETEVEFTDLIPDLKINNDIEALTTLILSDIDRELIQSGNDVKIYLDVQNISKSISEKEKELIAGYIKGYSVDCYLDINMFKQFNEGEKTQITELNGKISITVGIPEPLINRNSNIKREYGIVRIHNEEVELLPVQYDGERQTLTFETDKFSIYAIIYKDSAITGNDPMNGTDIEDGSDWGFGSGETETSDDVSSDLEKLQENVDSSSKERAVNTGDKNNIQLYIIGTIASVFIIINSWRKFLRMKE